jgi:rfaE bifunctional protein kinase chain/domain/rfaE bifunctional protein nucleotidyltransferase chain/domain
MDTHSIRERFSHKIKSIDEVRAVVGVYPREKSVVMCHGTFDVVHPGHLRHLLYAKSKADVLVVSVTADVHVSKGELRPHVPQDLRAASLAAYEFVDFVVIDGNATPIENLRTLQPDFFVKGFDYSAGVVNPKTDEERETVTAYGGQMIFSPGDFVLSSTRLIRSAPPDIRYERLLSVMDRAKITFDDLRRTLASVTGTSVCVLGDTIIDSYTRCSMIGGQTKTPTVSVLFESLEHFVGGAGVVAKHLAAAGAQVDFLTLLGDDELGRFAIKDLEATGVAIRPIIDKSRPTTDKNAILVDQYRLLKVDTLDNRPMDGTIRSRFSELLGESTADVVVFSDFRHGIFNRASIPELTKSIPPQAFKVADSQVASRWGNITEFVGFDLITPNEREARFSLGDQDSNLRSLASTLYAEAQCKVLILKLGERGSMTYKSQSPTDLAGWFQLDSFTTSAIDPVGAGDALLAYASLALKVSESPEQAAILGSIAAACECEVDGNVPVSHAEVAARIDVIERVATFDS